MLHRNVDHFYNARSVAILQQSYVASDSNNNNNNKKKNKISIYVIL